MVKHVAHMVERRHPFGVSPTPRSLDPNLKPPTCDQWKQMAQGEGIIIRAILFHTQDTIESVGDLG